ncbi:hypothetical protein ACP275_10G185900 [Erythranthe tilingii]
MGEIEAQAQGIRDLPTSLLVRNLRYNCRTEDLRGPFGEFGPLKDVYLPRDYYTGELRGFGFVEYVDPEDAAEAKYEMDGQILLGRELTVVFAEENRKKPSQMRARERRRETSSPIGDYRSRRSYSIVLHQYLLETGGTREEGLTQGLLVAAAAAPTECGSNPPLY